MSAVSWDTIQDAVVAWVIGASGLTKRHVVWDHWKGPRPATPFVELAISEDAGVGEPWLLVDDAPDATPGAEVRTRARGHRQVQLTLQAYGQTDRGDLAMPLMSDIISGLDLAIDDLDAAGAGVGEVGAVQAAGGSKGSVLEPRARCQVTLHVGSEVERRDTFIERVEGTIFVDSPAVEIPFTVQLST